MSEADTSLKSKGQREDTVFNAILKLAIKITLVILVIAGVFRFITGVSRIDDIGMTPSINPGDLLVYYRLDKEYAASDVVIFDYKGEKRAARVVAVAGETVDIDDKGLVVNGSRQYEPKVYDDTLAVRDGVDFPLTVKEGRIFIMGDNRRKAADSRLFGAIDIDDTYGKVISVIRRRDI